MPHHYVDDAALLRAAESAVPDRTDRLAVRAALERFLARQPRVPDLIGAKVAARVLHVRPPYISRLREQGRMPEPVPVEGTNDAYIRREVESLSREIEEARERRRLRREAVGA